MTAEAASLVERERALTEREQRFDLRLTRDAKALDERRDALALLGRELREREARLAGLDQRASDLDARDHAVAERERLLAAGELQGRSRSDELDAREHRLGEREDELHAREARLLADELGVRRRADELDAQAAAAPPALEPRAPARTAAQAAADRCVLFVPGAEGYRLVSLDVTPPAVGESVEIDGERFEVARVGPSPLPADERPCVFLAA